MAWQHEVKAQPVRVLDVLIVGPLMLYAGRKLAPTDVLLGNAMAALGLLTIVYNGNNWLRIRDEMRGR